MTTATAISHAVRMTLFVLVVLSVTLGAQVTTAQAAPTPALAQQGPCGAISCGPVTGVEGPCGANPCASVPVAQGPCGANPCAPVPAAQGPCGATPCPTVPAAETPCATSPCGVPSAGGIADQAPATAPKPSASMTPVPSAAATEPPAAPQPAATAAATAGDVGALDQAAQGQSRTDDDSGTPAGTSSRMLLLGLVPLVGALLYQASRRRGFGRS